jgi:hypothetical protein
LNMPKEDCHIHAFMSFIVTKLRGMDRSWGSLLYWSLYTKHYIPLTCQHNLFSNTCVSLFKQRNRTHLTLISKNVSILASLQHRLTLTHISFRTTVETQYYGLLNTENRD